MAAAPRCAEMAPIPSLLATSALHHHLLRQKTRTQVGLIVESGDAREVHHIALLIGYGAVAVNPYMATESVETLAAEGLLGDTTPEVISGIIADEAAIGMVNCKTTAVRVIPAVGKKIGDELEFGGLLGSGPVMKVNTKSPAQFINRGGKIPAPMHSLKN